MFDYANGKMDWLAADLPSQGAALFVGAFIDRRVPTCRPDEKIVDVLRRVGESPICVVVAANGVVVGCLRCSDARSTNDPQSSVERVMEFGPATIRPSDERPEVDERLGHDPDRVMLVTRANGSLLGAYSPSRDR